MKSSIKYILLFVAIIFSSLAIKAQTEKSGEAAVQIGGNYYLGDLNHFPFKGTRPAVGIFYRHNFNSRYSIKGLGYGGLLTGKGKSPDGLSHSFSKFYGQLDAIGEFNFTPFIVGKKNSIYTTYLQAGAGILYYPSADKLSSLFKFDIPMGFGFKMNISSRFVAGADYLMYKVFSDNLDYKGQHITAGGDDYQHFYAGNKDWISYFGIYLAYKIEYPEKCPAFD